MANSLAELIGDCKYLLDFQKKQLIIDLDTVPLDDERIGDIIDAVFYRLFGKGFDSLTGEEVRDIYDAWKGAH